MSLGPVMIDLKGTRIDADERELLQHPMVGGVILFTRNYESVEQLIDLVADIHQLRTPRLLVAIDQEGGRVQRLREGFVRLPAVSRLGELYEQDRAHACFCAEKTGWLMASEMLAVGIDISFAPVLDLDYGISSVIGDRAFHRSAEVVAELAHAYVLGMKRAGMAATGKHFPGHGAVHADSHAELPVDERDLEDLMNDDLFPFERLAHLDIAAMMMAHVVFPAVDSVPASFSSVWIRDILRQQIGFQGVVFSDDLSMLAAESIGDFNQRAVSALQAGCDMILLCNTPKVYRQVLDTVAALDDPVSHLRLIRLHGRRRYDWRNLHTADDYLRAVEVVSSYEPAPLLDMDIE